MTFPKTVVTSHGSRYLVRHASNRLLTGALVGLRGTLGAPGCPNIAPLVETPSLGTSQGSRVRRLPLQQGSGSASPKSMDPPWRTRKAPSCTCCPVLATPVPTHLPSAPTRSIPTLPPSASASSPQKAGLLSPPRSSLVRLCSISPAEIWTALLLRLKTSRCSTPAGRKSGPSAPPGPYCKSWAWTVTSSPSPAQLPCC